MPWDPKRRAWITRGKKVVQKAKTFGGRRYTPMLHTNATRVADEEARKWRKKGHYVRVVESSTGWTVFVGPKRK